MLFVDSCSHFFCYYHVRSCKLQNELQPVKLKKKKALCLDNLNKFLISWSKTSNLAHQGLLTITLTEFCGFMTFSEVSRLRHSDFVFSSTYVKVFIKKIITGIYREEMWVYIPATSKICFLKQFEYYLALSKISENSEEFIFRDLSRGKNSSLRKKSINT